MDGLERIELMILNRLGPMAAALELLLFDRGLTDTPQYRDLLKAIHPWMGTDDIYAYIQKHQPPEAE